MRPLLNTLYVTLQGSYLSREGDTVTVRHEDAVKLRIPIRTLQGVVCFGQVSCSSFLMSLCAEYGVGISFMTEYGRFLARVQGPISGNVLLRKQQYRASDSPGPSLLTRNTNSKSACIRTAASRRIGMDSCLGVRREGSGVTSTIWSDASRALDNVSTCTCCSFRYSSSRQ